MKFLPSILIAQLILLPAAVFAEEKDHIHSPAASPEKADSYYQCSMHPWITSDKPGNCPICGMRLTKVQGGAQGEMKKGRTAVIIGPERRQMIGVTQEKAQMRPLVYSVHSVGHVAYYPDAAEALGEYRQAYGAYLKNRASPVLVEKAMRLMELAELKLRLLGMSSEQVEQFKTDFLGNRFSGKFFAPTGLVLPKGHVWVDMDLYEPDSEEVKAGDEALMASAALPGKIFKGTVKITEPVLNEFPRKVRARIETEEAGGLKAGMAVDIQIKVDRGMKLSVPEDAVIGSGLSQLVFVDQGEGRLEPREVEVGPLADGYYEIIAGLHEGETVITSATFLIDSESRLRAAAQGFSKPKSGEAAPASGHAH